MIGVAIGVVIIVGIFFLVQFFFWAALAVIVERWLKRWRDHNSVLACSSLAALFGGLGAFLAGTIATFSTESSDAMWWIWVGTGGVLGGLLVPWLLYHSHDSDLGH
ncbi:MAG: hypothetical protein AAF586_05260 [Planctomycetota bacterium]